MSALPIFIGVALFGQTHSHDGAHQPRKHPKNIGMQVVLCNVVSLYTLESTCLFLVGTSSAEKSYPEKSADYQSSFSMFHVFFVEIPGS